MQNASTDLTERDELERVWERARRDEEAMDALDTAVEAHCAQFERDAADFAEAAEREAEDRYTDSR